VNMLNMLGFQIFMDKLVVYSSFLPYLDLFIFTYQQLIYLNIYKLGDDRNFYFHVSFCNVHLHL